MFLDITMCMIILFMNHDTDTIVYQKITIAEAFLYAYLLSC